MVEQTGAAFLRKTCVFDKQTTKQRSAFFHHEQYINIICILYEDDVTILLRIDFFDNFINNLVGLQENSPRKSPHTDKILSTANISDVEKCRMTWEERIFTSSFPWQCRKKSYYYVRISTLEDIKPCSCLPLFTSLLSPILLDVCKSRAHQMRWSHK